jgi:hypothetical protein
VLGIRDRNLSHPPDAICLVPACCRAGDFSRLANTIGARGQTGGCMHGSGGWAAERRASVAGGGWIGAQAGARSRGRVARGWRARQCGEHPGAGGSACERRAAHAGWGGGRTERRASGARSGGRAASVRGGRRATHAGWGGRRPARDWAAERIASSAGGRAASVQGGRRAARWVGGSVCARERLVCTCMRANPVQLARQGYSRLASAIGSNRDWPSTPSSRVGRTRSGAYRIRPTRLARPPNRKV